MSTFDFINYLRLNSVERSAKTRDKLDELQQRASLLAQDTGERPFSWYEFKKNSPESTPSRLPSFLKGTLVGAGVGVLFNAMMGATLGAGSSLLPGLALGSVMIPGLVVAWALAGGLIGLLGSDPEGKQRQDLVNSYEHYLDAFENRQRRSEVMNVEPRAPETSMNVDRQSQLPSERSFLQR